MRLPMYEIKPEAQNGKEGYRICLKFKDELLPIPNLWFHNPEIARLRITKLEQEDFDLWREERTRR